MNDAVAAFWAKDAVSANDAETAIDAVMRRAGTCVALPAPGRLCCPMIFFHWTTKAPLTGFVKNSSTVIS